MTIKTGLFKFLKKKPDWRRLAILLIILAVVSFRLWEKNRTESALVTNGSELEAVIWELGAFRLPGAPNGATRQFATTDANGQPLTIEMEFGDPLNPQPSRLSITTHPDQPAHPAHARFTIEAPFSHPVLTAESNSTEEFTLEGAVSLATSVKESLARDWALWETFTWQEVEPGLEMASIQLRYGMRLGRSELHVLRIDPQQFTFRPYHEKEYGGTAAARDTQMNIAGWGKQLPSAAALLNGGQYHKNREYIGLLTLCNRSCCLTAREKYESTTAFIWLAGLLSGKRLMAGSG